MAQSKEGDTVKSGDVIAEIETDKATMEVEAVDEGTVAKIVVPAGTEGVKVSALSRGSGCRRRRRVGAAASGAGAAAALAPKVEAVQRRRLNLHRRRPRQAAATGSASGHRGAGRTHQVATFSSPLARSSGEGSMASICLAIAASEVRMAASSRATWKPLPQVVVQRLLRPPPAAAAPRAAAAAASAPKGASEEAVLKLSEARLLRACAA